MMEHDPFQNLANTINIVPPDFKSTMSNKSFQCSRRFFFVRPAATVFATVRYIPPNVMPNRVDSTAVGSIIVFVYARAFTDDDDVTLLFEVLVVRYVENV